jgi:hypothetical protein
VTFLQRNRTLLLGGALKVPASHAAQQAITPAVKTWPMPMVPTKGSTTIRFARFIAAGTLPEVLLL